MSVAPDKDVDRGTSKKLFISYAHGEPEEESLALWLYDSLIKAGHEAFLDEKSIRLGDNWRDAIQAFIPQSDFFIILLSAKSVRSEVVEQEVRIARETRRKHSRPVYLPVRVKYEDNLDLELGAYLNNYQWRHWRGQADSEPILREILEIASGQAPVPEGQPQQVDGSVLSQPDVDWSKVPPPGGPMQSNHLCYIRRSRDKEVLDAADRPVETIIIKAPMEMGKSSLLNRYLTACQNIGKRTALVNMTSFEQERIADYPTFLRLIAECLLEELGLDIKLADDVTSQGSLTRLLQKVVLDRVRDSVVIAFDNLELVLRYTHQTNFFRLLKTWHERRTHPQPGGWERAGLALVISTEPYLLMREVDESPFNVRAPIELHSFSLEQCREMNHVHNNLLNDDQLAQLWYLLGGHPYLTHEAFYRLAITRSISFDELIDSAHQEDGLFKDHLQRVRDKLNNYSERNLLEIMEQVVASSLEIDRDSFHRLSSVGLVCKQGSKAVPSNGLYAKFFGGAR